MPSANHFYAAGPAADREGGPNDEPTVLVRKLGSTAVPTYLERLLTQDGEQRFVVVERLSRGSMTEDEASECVHDARMAAALEHPNVVRTRAINVRPDEISVTSDYVAGERMSELWSPANGSTAKLPLAIALRILIDVATGLGALHKLRIAEGQERIKFVHGEVTAANVLVGLDGVSVVLRAARVRRRNELPRAGVGTLAPEVLSGEAADQRADIYSLGALLWQALSGRPLFADDDVNAILASAKEGTVAPAVVPKDASWALSLADVAARALALVPDKRFPTASSMVTELRKTAGPKLATAVEVAEFLEAVAGEKIAARLADVQPSAVIRKATSSIPAPRSVPPPVVAVAAPVMPAPVKLMPVPPDSAPDEAITLTAPVSPRSETARAETFSQAPIEPPTLPAPAAKPSDGSRGGPPAQAKPISTPRKLVGTTKGVPVVPPSRLAARVSPAVFPSAPTTSPLAHLGVRVAIGASLAIALLTGWFAYRAIHDRQDIVTPGTTPMDASTLLDISKAPAPVSSTIRGEPAAGAANRRQAAPVRVGSGQMTTATAKGGPAKPTASNQAPPPKPGR